MPCFSVKGHSGSKGICVTGLQGLNQDLSSLSFGQAVSGKPSPSKMFYILHLLERYHQHCNMVLAATGMNGLEYCF